MSNSLKENAILMRLSLGLPGEQRNDRSLTEKVKSEHGLGLRAGKWDKFIYPTEALLPIKQLDSKARAYHDAVTLPFDSGVGILPGALIMEYGERMRDFCDQRKHLVQSHFLNQYDRWIEWAKTEHNGSFDASLYPGASVIAAKFYFRTEPLPVPDGTHFSNTMASLLGTDTEAVNRRVADAGKEAQRELLRRMIEPVAHMAKTLSKEEPRIFDTLISNIEDIVRVAPALNLSGDPQIDAFTKEMKALAVVKPDHLRESKEARAMCATRAAEVFQRLSAYKL
jgi:hypothetical protein